MFKTHRPTAGKLQRHAGRSILAASALVVAIGASSVAAAQVARTGSAEAFAATFETSTGRPSITACAGLGPEGKKITGRYDGTLTIPAEGRRLAARFSIEIRLDGRTGVGSADGKWQLVDPPDPDVVGRGELIGVVNLAQPPDPEVNPPDPDLVLRGLLIGLAQPPDPDMPDQRLIANFRATLAADAKSLSGVAGDPPIEITGDPPSEGELVPAVLIAPSAC
jgi:hypothetical protein